MYLPNSTVYVARQADYYSASAVEHPWGIVQPRNANEVALIVKTLLNAGAHWAVRSGGHTAWGAAADSKNDLTLIFLASHLCSDVVAHEELTIRGGFTEQSS